MVVIVSIDSTLGKEASTNFLIDMNASNITKVIIVKMEAIELITLFLIETVVLRIQSIPKEGDEEYPPFILQWKFLVNILQGLS